MSFQKRYLVIAEPLDDPFSYAVNIYDTKSKIERMEHAMKDVLKLQTPEW